MSKNIIANAHIITMNSNMDIIENGSILIEDGKIKNISSDKICDAEATYTDVHKKFVLPGFINTHTHVPMTMLRGFADDLPLKKWLTEYIFPTESRAVTEKNVKIATRLALLEMIKSGTTCFNDMYFFENAIAEEAKHSGIRAIVGEAIMDFPTPSYKTLSEGFHIAKEFIERWKGDETITPSISAHAPYTCSKVTLQKTKEIADKFQTLLHIHLAETHNEVENIKEQTGMTPVQYLNSIGLLDTNVIAAHCVWLDSKDIELMAKSQTNISHCPKSNLKLASGIANVHKYIKAGINVGIATDGTASNNNLDMIEETRFAALLSKAINHNPEAMNAQQALKSATIDGARALGMDNLIGSLEIGKEADLIVIDQENTNMIPIYDDYSSIVYAMNSHNVHSSMVHGQWIMKNRIVLNVDEKDTLSRMKSMAQSILKG